MQTFVFTQPPRAGAPNSCENPIDSTRWPPARISISTLRGLVNNDHWFHEYGSIVFILITLLSWLYLHDAMSQSITHSTVQKWCSYSNDSLILLFTGGESSDWAELKKTGPALMIHRSIERSLRKKLTAKTKTSLFWKNSVKVEEDINRRLQDDWGED